MWDQKSVETKYAMILRLHVTNPVTIGFISKVNRASRIQICMCSMCVYQTQQYYLRIIKKVKQKKTSDSFHCWLQLAPSPSRQHLTIATLRFCMNIPAFCPWLKPRAAAAFTKTLNNLNYICVHSVQHNQNEQQRTARKMSPRMQNLCYELLMPPRKQNLPYELLIFSA